MIRRFATALACLPLVLAAQAASSSWPPNAKSVEVHMIGQGHIDPVWLWPLAEGVSVVHSTFRSALDRMNENAGFKFTASSAQFYAWVAENDPAMLAEIRKRVEEGRWALVGGWWVEPDVNLPSGESLVRQGLYGQLTYRRLFGRIATSGYNPDSFGHPGTLPQILKLQGMSNYVFMRPQPGEKKMPSDLFWWQSPDGSRILTFRILLSYNDEGAVRERIEQILASQKPPLPVTMAFYGVGDHGGGATKENLRSIAEIQKEPGAPHVLFSTPDEYFASVRQASASAAPVFTGDLQHHSVGCYTAESYIKKANRSTEIALGTAEKIAAIGSVAWSAAYPKSEFTKAWERILLLQFHDSLAGTSLPEHYEHAARDGFGYAQSVARNAMYMAAQKLAWQVPTKDPESEYLVVFNPHAWDTTTHVEYDLPWHSGGPSRVETEKGEVLAHQWIPATTEVNGRMRLVAAVPVPAFGYRQIRVRKAADSAPATDVHAAERTLENEHLRVTVGVNGELSIFDKDAQRDVFAPGATGARAVVLDDPSDTWSHDVRAYTKEIGAFGKATVSAGENGPVRASLRVHSTYGQSSLTTEWLLYAGSRRLEARVSLDWHEHQKLLKFSFPVNTAAPRATYEVPYGTIVREANGDEDPGQRWVDVGGPGYGLAVVNDAKYGYSVHGNDLRVSIVRGAPYAHHIPHVLDPKAGHLWQDQGVQTFRMLLVPHRGTWQEAALPRIAEEFTVAGPVIYQGIHSGSRPEAASLLAVDAPNVSVSAIKQAEDNDDLIFRCYETDGRAATAQLDLRFANRRWTGQFRPYEIKTLRFHPQTGEIREVNLLEE